LRKWDGTEKGWQGYHAHVLASTRKFGREGFGAKAEIELSDTKRKSLGLSDGATEIERIREMWEVAANRHLEQANKAQRIDRRSLKDQGIERDPTVHLGPGVTALEREGVSSRLGDINRQVVAEEKAQRIPERAAERTTEWALEKTPEKAAEPRVDRRQFLTQYELGVIDEMVDRAVAAVYRERDERVKRVLAKAQLREQRREKAYRSVQVRPPVPPQGLLTTLQQKGHQQALLAWQASKEAAAKLVEQAKRLGERLLEASGVKQLMAWSQETLKHRQPELVARRDELVRQSEARSPTLQPGKASQNASQLEPEPPERVPFWEQPGFDPKTFVGTRGRDVRQAEPSLPAPESPPKDIKTQAAEGVAAFRARREKERQAKLEQGQPEKSYGDKMLEQLKAQVEAEQKAAEKERARQREQSKGPSRGRGKDKDGPEMGD
nr:MobA/MobL family protein [Pseudomonadota bacterium]